MNFFLFLLLFFFYRPSSVKAIICEFDGDCVPISKFNFSVMSPSTNHKTCDDFCVYFQCQIGSDKLLHGVQKVMRGSGCWDDFYKACKGVIAMDKMDMYDDVKYQHYDKYSGIKSGRYKIAQHQDNATTIDDWGIDLVACNSTDNCATNAASKNWNFGRIKDLWIIDSYASDFETCDYDASQPISLPSVTCNYGEINKTLKEYKDFKKYYINAFNTTETKICDACVYYRCIVDIDEIVIGYGCLDDFETSCERVLWPGVTRRIQPNIKSYAHYNDNLVFYSCSDSNYCAKNGDTYFFSNADMDFGLYGSDDMDGKHSFNEYNHPKLEVVECSLGGICEAASQHDLKNPIVLNFAQKKNCSSCVYFHCYIGNKIVKAGYGCLEDFERLCPPSSTSEEYNKEIKKEMKLMFAYEPNYMLYSCSDGNDCAFKYGSRFLQTYVTSNVSDDRVKPKNIDTTFTGKCNYEGDNNDILNDGGSTTCFNFVKIAIVFITLFVFIW